MLLILDEEQTGLGKTGDMFAFEQEGVVPDIITLAKHFGGGICISSVTTSAEIEERVVADEFIVTHSHSNDPLAAPPAPPRSKCWSEKIFRQKPGNLAAT